jgi:ABC-type sulfate/molybdate transport systems ATPase subunit
MRSLIRGVITSTGIAAVLVTHDLQEAEELADVVIDYADGRVLGQRTVTHPTRLEGPRESAAGSEEE